MKVMTVLVFNVFLAAMLHQGLVAGQAVAWWIFVAIFGIVGIIFSFGWSSKMMRAVRAEAPPSAFKYQHIIRPLSVLFDTAFIVALVFYGHYLMATWVLYTVMAYARVCQEMDRDC